MADINYTITGTVSKGSFRQSFNAAAVTADMSFAGLYSISLNLGTSVTQVSTASLTSLGLCFVQNLATAMTHTVSLGRYDGPSSALYETVTLRAGESAVLRLAAGSYAAKAAVAGSRMTLTIYEG